MIPRNAARRASIIASYRGGLSLRECGKLYGVSTARISQIIKEEAPEIMRPKHYWKWKLKDLPSMIKGATK